MSVVVKLISLYMFNLVKSSRMLQEHPKIILMVVECYNVPIWSGLLEVKTQTREK